MKAAAVPVCDAIGMRVAAAEEVAAIQRDAARFGVRDNREYKNATDHLVAMEGNAKQAQEDFRSAWKQPFNPKLCAP
jgi:hypothetical protein